MKSLICGSILAISLISSVVRADSDSAKSGAPARITIGIIPGEDPERLKKAGLELADYVQKKLGIPTDIYVSQTYQGLIDAMKTGKVDFAFFTAMTFVFAEKEAGAKILLKKVWQNPYYFSTVVTRKSQTKLNSLKDLKGKSIAFVDERSGSGYLYPRAALDKLGIGLKDLKSHTFSGNHEAAILALVEGKVDAAAVFADGKPPEQNAWFRFSPKTLKQMKLIWISAPIPNDPFCVSRTFYDKFPRVTHDLMFSLIEMKDGPPEENVLNRLFGVRALELATTRQYEPVRELVRRLKLGVDP
jgi:phosphonate transport system substrate-binding protein